MNSNQSKNLTQKQKELVKKLESIRKNRDSTDEQLNKPKKTGSSVSSQRRNENTRQDRPTPANTRKKVEKRRPRTVKPSEFARPVAEPAVTIEPKVEYKSQMVKSRKRVQQSKVRTKKNNDEHYIKQLSDGKKLSQAIILSEILAKPVALRKR